MSRVLSRLPTFSNPLDPNTWAEWVNERLSEAASDVVESIVELLSNPPNLIDSSWAAVLFGNVKGVLPALINLALVVGAFILIVSQKGASKILPTLLLAAVVMAALPAFYWSANELYDAGTTLTEAAKFGEDVGTKVQEQVLPVEINVVLGFISFVMITFLAMVIYCVLTVYAILDVTILFWVPLVATFYFLFEGARKIMKILFAILLVAMLAGRPTFMFFLRSGNAFLELIGVNDALMQFIVVYISLLLGLLFQFFWVWVAYKGVSHVESMIQGGQNRSEVHGKVKSEQEGSMKVDLLNAFNIHAKGLETAPKVQASEEVASKEARKLAIKQTATTASSEVVAAGAAYFGVPYPAAKAVTGAAAQQVNKRTAQRSDERVARQPATRPPSKPPGK
jgi:hypothetical protein